MIVAAENGGSRLVPLDESVPRIVEEHVRAEISYITVE
jgi:hypothetical protein